MSQDNNDTNSETPTRPTSPTPSIETSVTTNSIIIPATKADGTPVKIWMCAESREKRRKTQKAYREKKSKELKEKMQRLEQLEAIVNGVGIHTLTLVEKNGIVSTQEYRCDDGLVQMLDTFLTKLMEKNIIAEFKID